MSGSRLDATGIRRYEKMPEDLPPAIIFDLDDTILSDDEASEMCWRQVCDDFAHRITAGTPAELATVIREYQCWYLFDPERIRDIGNDVGRAWREILSLAFDRQGIENVPLEKEMTAAYMSLKAETVRLIPGALDTLRSLRAQGIRLGLITNGDAQGQRSKVVKAGLEPLFESVLIAGEFGAAKPDPEVFRHTLSRLEATPELAWMVGDNLVTDIGGAQAVGIYGVWVDRQGQGLPTGNTFTPDRTIRSIVELVNGTVN
ncbi:MAG: HAD-IA family hydrolase [Chloroflexi bacterium]|nr:HAD-IA family hydrolase [Chloroflexota bacterium]